MSRGLRVFAPIIALVGIALSPGVAQAQPYEHTRYSGTDSFSEEICGLEVSVDVEFSGVLVILPVHDSDQAFLAQNNYEVTEHVTNPANGHQLVLYSNGEFHEYTARQIEGDVWEFEFLDAGRFTMSDPQGNVLLRDRGVVKVRTVFDTLGDGQPGGELISEELLSVNGPHSTEDAFCAAFLGQLA